MVITESEKRSGELKVGEEYWKESAGVKVGEIILGHGAAGNGREIGNYSWKDDCTSGIFHRNENERECFLPAYISYFCSLYFFFTRQRILLEHRVQV